MVNMGIIGMGRFGMMHADWIGKYKELKLIAAAKRSTDRIKEIEDKYHIEVYTDIDKFLDKRDIDYVIISTTNEVHEDLTIRALEKGKNVIVEKPMSMDYKGSVRMVEAAKKYNKKLFVFHSTLWDKDYLLVKETLESGILGKILVIRSSAVFFGALWAGWGIHGMKDPWRLHKKQGGGLLMDWAPHLFTQLYFLIGKEPVGVYGKLLSGIWSSEVDDHFTAIVDFGDDAIYQMEATNNCRLPHPRWYIVGTKGTMSMISRLTNVWDEAEINYVKEDGTNESKKIKIEDNPGAGCTGGFYADFVEYIKGGKKEFLSMYMSSLGMKIIDAVKESHSKKRYISV